ncbi:MAG: LEA type 2 family protein [Bacteroidia bacterium]|nr:LEA type 2 family protein [Bacteroidia bacterium]
MKKVQKVKFDILNESPSVGFEILVKNPNSSGLRLRHVDADLFFKDKFLGKATLAHSIKIPKESEFSIPFQINFESRTIETLIPAGIDLLFGSKILPMRVQGTVFVRKFLWFKKYRFDIKQDIDADILKLLH